MPLEKKCATCRFSERDWREDLLCRRRAPSRTGWTDQAMRDGMPQVGVVQGGISSGWPTVLENDWCGEWEAREGTDAA